MTRACIPGSGQRVLSGWRTIAVFGAAMAVSATCFAQSGTPANQANENARTAPQAAGAGVTQKSANPDGVTGARAQAYYHFALGHLDESTAEQFGRPDLAEQAVEQYKVALSHDPNSVFLQNSLAEIYFRMGDVRQAIDTAQNVLKSHPDNIASHKLLGHVYLRSLGNSGSGQQSATMLDLAIEQFEKIAQLQPSEADNHLVLGQLYSMKGNTAKAKEEFESAGHIAPGSEGVALGLARLYGQQGDMKQAIAALEQVPADQRSPRIDLTLGAAYDQIKKPKLAIPAYQAALDLQPDNLPAQRGLAEDLLQTNQPGAALKIYQGITTQDPEDAHSFLRLAELERSMGHMDKAKAAVAQAKALDPNSIEVKYNEAMIAQSAGDLNRAATILQQLVDGTRHTNGEYNTDEKNNRAIFLGRLATVYRDQNKTSEAISTYEEMIALGGSAAERGYQGEVDAYRDAKKLPEALAAAQRAAKALPKNADLQLTLAAQLADSGKAKQGLALAKAQLNGSSHDRIVWLTLAQMETRQHKWKDAAEAIDHAEKLSNSKPELAIVHFLRGALQERQKHIEAAEQEFRQTLALDPNNALALNYLGYMLADHGMKLNEALHLIQHAVQLDPENGAYLDSLGWVRYKLGQYELAQQMLEKAVALMPTDPEVHDHLGEVYASQGHLREAVAQWESSLANYANSAKPDAEPSDVNKVRKRLDKARVKLAKEESETAVPHRP